MRALSGPSLKAIAGEHNALNATAAAALASGLASQESIQSALASFKRSSVALKFAPSSTHHHRRRLRAPPTAIRETLRALRSVYPQSRLWAVLEPRSNTLRRKVLQSDLVASLSLADRVVLAGVYQQQRIPDAERLHPRTSSNPCTAQGAQANCTPMERHCRRHRTQLEPDDVVAILSNGALTASMKSFRAPQGRFSADLFPVGSQGDNRA